MVGNQGHEPMMTREARINRRATRFAVNRNWSRRGDSTKYRSQK